MANKESNMRELKDWTFDELLTNATWIVMESVLRGELKHGVHSAINLALRWKHESEQGK